MDLQSEINLYTRIVNNLENKVKDNNIFLVLSSNIENDDIKKVRVPEVKAELDYVFKAIKMSKKELKIWLKN